MGEFEGGDEAGLLVQAAEVTGQVDDGILFLERFIGHDVCILTFSLKMYYSIVAKGIIF